MNPTEITFAYSFPLSSGEVKMEQAENQGGNSVTEYEPTAGDNPTT